MMSDQTPPQVPYPPGFQQVPQPRWVPQTQYQPPQGTYFPQLQGFPVSPPPPFYKAPPPKKHGVLIAVIIGALSLLVIGVIGVASNPATQKGFQAGVDAAHPTAPAAHVSTVPAPPPAPATVVVKETVVVQPTLSSNAQMLRIAWNGMSTADKADLQASWLKYKDSATYSAVFIDAFLDTMSEYLPTLTRAEVIEFFTWMSTQ